MRRIAGEQIEKQSLDAQLLGPAPAPIERIKALWRWHMLIKSRKSSALNLLLRTLQQVPPGSTKLRMAFDLDPQDML